MDRLILILCLSALAWALVWCLRWWAEGTRILDIPNERSSHIQPTPRGGGLAIVVVTLGATGWYYLARGPSPPLLGYLLGGGMIAAIGWLDDLRSIPSWIRLLCQAVGALAVVLPSSAAFEQLGAGSASWLIALGYLVWIVSLTNMYNFMDGIDGLAGGQAVVASLTWVWLGWYAGSAPIGLIAGALCASSIGFLLHNWSPARIFMGDVSSTFLGYTFAALPLLLPASAIRWPIVIGAVLAVWPFLFDGGLTLVRRAAQGENIFQAHRSHLYQRLVIRGWSHRAVSALYAAYAAISAVCAIGVVQGSRRWGLVALSPTLGVALFLLVRREERRVN